MHLSGYISPEPLLFGVFNTFHLRNENLAEILLEEMKVIGGWHFLLKILSGNPFLIPSSQ